MHSEISTELRNLVRSEEQRILVTFPDAERRIAVLEHVRANDLFYLSQKSPTAWSHDSNEQIQTFYVYGCNKALRLFLDMTTHKDMVPLGPSTTETHAWASSVL